MPRQRIPSDPSNATSDGDYKVGKGRPPEHGKFRKGDGRKRGRRPKGTNNLATDLREVLDSAVSVSVAGVPKRLSRQRAIVMRMADNATKGQTSAIALTLDLQQRLVDPILQKEEEDRKLEFNAKSLTHVEVVTTIYLESKALGVECSQPQVVGVIPIYAAGHCIGEDERDEIARGLAAYGVKASQVSWCSLGRLPDGNFGGDGHREPDT